MRRLPAVVAILPLFVLSSAMYSGAEYGLQTTLAPSSIVPHSISISGYINYFDDNLAREVPIQKIAVALVEKDGHSDRQIESTYTNDSGFYSFRNVNIPSPDDGVSGNIHLEVSFQNDVLEIIDVMDNLYRFQLSPMIDVTGGQIIADYFLDENNQHRGLGHIFNCIMDAYDFMREDLNWERRKITVKWPHEELSRYTYSYSKWFGGVIMRDYIHVAAGREWNRTAIIHEYGHSVMTALYGYNVHNLPEMATEHEIHYMYTVSDPGFAMREGWAEFFQALVDDNAYNAIVHMDADTPNIESNNWWTGSSDAIGTNRQGELVEGAVASILWDIADTDASRDGSPGVDDDGMNGMLEELWRLMAKHKPANILKLWHVWVENYYSQPEMLYCIYKTHGIRVDPPWDTNENDGAPPLLLTSGPLVSDVTATSAVVKWLTDEASSSVVEYGAEHGNKQVAKNASSRTEHSILLSPLSSDTIYEYRVGSTNMTGNTVWSQSATFRTLDNPGVKGDVNGDGEIQSNDAILILSIAVGALEPTDCRMWAADMNDDGGIGSDDAISILRKIVGLNTPETNAAGEN
jgi:hypothetical protein